MSGSVQAPNPVTLMAYDPVSHLFWPVAGTNLSTDTKNEGYITLQDRASQAAAVAGTAYNVTSGEYFSGTGNVGITLFNPASTKNIAIYSIPVWNESNSAFFTLNKITTYVAFDTPLTPNNHLLSGGIASALSSSNVSYSSNTFASIAGTPLICLSTTQGDTKDLLEGKGPIILPAGANTGILVYLTGASGIKLAWNLFWYEY